MSDLRYLARFLALSAVWSACSGTPKTSSSTNQPPTAVFTVSGDAVALGTLIFDASQSADPDGDALQFTWEFGDNNRGGVNRLAHIFSKAGTFNVKLTVVDARGERATSTQPVTIAAGTPSTKAIPLIMTVRDTNGVIIVGADVTIEGSPSAAVSDASGLASVSIGTDIEQTIHVLKPGYARQLRTVRFPSSLTTASLDVTLIPRAAAQTIADIGQGGTVNAGAGAKLELPPNALIDEQGNAIKGAVEVAVTPVDVRNATQQFPGGFGARNQNGDPGLMLSFGVMEFALTQEGKALNLAPGATATTEVPMYAGQHPNGSSVAAGDEIPLWSLDESTGTWVQEGVGIVVASASSPSGFAMRAKLGHFSWWNCDSFSDSGRGEAKCRVVEVTATQEKIEAVEAGVCFIGANYGDQGPQRQAGGGAPVFAAATQIPFNTAYSLILPANLPLNITANAENGTWGGSSTTQVDIDGVVTIDIVVGQRATNTGTEPVAITVPTERTDVISEVGGTARYTLTSPGGLLRIQAGQSGSNVAGILTVTRSGQTPGANLPFAASMAQQLLETEAGEVLDIVVTATSGAPGAIQLIANLVNGQQGTLPFSQDYAFVELSSFDIFIELNAGDGIEVTALRNAGSSGSGKVQVTDVSTGATTFRLFDSTSGNVTPLRVIAPTTGNYLFTVSGSAVTGTVTASTLSLGGKIVDVGPLPFFSNEFTPTELTFLKFSATAGQKIGYFARRTTGAALFELTLHSPMPTVRQDASNNSCLTQLPTFTAPVTGDYYLEVDPNGATSPHDITIEVVRDLPIGTMDPGSEALLDNQARFYQFTRTTQTHAYLDNIGAPICAYSPDGTVLSIAPGGLFAPYPLPLAGTYTVTATPTVDRAIGAWAIGAADYNPPTAMGGGPNIYPVAGSLVGLGEVDAASLELAAGDFVALEMSTADPVRLKARLLRPDDPPWSGATTLSIAAVTSSNPSYCDAPTQVAAAGTYTLWINSLAASLTDLAGDYAGRLIRRTPGTMSLDGNGDGLKLSTLNGYCDFSVNNFTIANTGIYRLRSRYNKANLAISSPFPVVTEVETAAGATVRTLSVNVNNPDENNNARWGSGVVSLNAGDYRVTSTSSWNANVVGTDNVEFEVIPIAQPTVLTVGAGPVTHNISRQGKWAFFRVSVPLANDFSIAVSRTSGSLAGRVFAYVDSANWYADASAANIAIAAAPIAVNRTATAPNQSWVIAVKSDEISTGEISISVSQP